MFSVVVWIVRSWCPVVSEMTDCSTPADRQQRNSCRQGCYVYVRRHVSCQLLIGWGHIHGYANLREVRSITRKPKWQIPLHERRERRHHYNVAVGYIGKDSRRSECKAIVPSLCCKRHGKSLALCTSASSQAKPSHSIPRLNLAPIENQHSNSVASRAGF